AMRATAADTATAASPIGILSLRIYSVYGAGRKRDLVPGDLQRAVLLDDPAGVVRDLPRVTVRIDEDPRVASPEGLGGVAADRRARLARLLDELVDLLDRARVVGEGDAAPAAPIW